MANKKQKKGLMNVLFILVFVIMFSMIISPYKVSYPSEGNQYSGTGLGGLYQQFDTSKYCKEGNDFVFQVKPFSCTPKVVRSDLLEEQDVPVFCTISATQLNPLLDVKEIETLNFKGEYPRGVKTIGFQPERAALGYENDLNTPIMEDIGSAVIVLRREPNESAMPDYVEGNITAQIRYNAENAFGIGKTEFYLPSMSDSDWNEKQEYYSFWDGKGYLRATNIRSDKARISIYSDKYKTKSSSNYLEKIESFGQTLNAGEKSGRIYLPGFNPCMANLQVKLVSIENPSTTARLKVNSEIIEIKQGEKFLNEKCRIVNVEKQGLLQYVTLDCEEDEDGFLEKNNFELFFSPKIDMNVNGQNGTYEIGDKLYDSTMDGEEGGVFLGYVGVKGDKILGDIDKEDLFAVLVFYPEEKEKLSRTEITQVSRLVDDIGTYSDAKGMNEFERVWDGIKKVSGNIRKVGGNFISGRQIQVIPFSQDGKREFSFKEKDISIINFAGARNKEFSDEASNEDVQNFEEYYENSIEDYNTLINGYPGEDYSRNMKYKEKAMRDKIKLAFNTEQKRDLKEMCKKFEQEYPNNEIPSECGSDYLFSNSRTSTKDVLIDGRVRSISFGGIYDPSYEEFGAEIMIENKSGFRKSYKLRKDQKIFLDDEGKDYIKLEELDKEKREAEIEVSLEKKGEVDEDENEFVSGDKKLKIGDSKTFLSDYEFILRDINLEKVALVRLDPNIDYSKSTADFNFRVGIEKRALQLSPEKTKQRLEDVNKTIKQLEEISGYLDDTTKAMKGACLATKGYLTVKSFINNAKGKGEARNIVMRGAGGWNEKCLRAAEREGSEYDSQEECLNANADKIDAQVERYTQIMNNQDENLKQLQNAHMTENKLLGESFVDTEGFANDYSKRVSSSLEGVNENYFEQNDIDKENIQNVLNNEDSWKTKQYTIQELKQIERYSQALKQDPEDPVAKKELASVLKDVEVNSKKFLEKEDFSERTGMGRNSRVLEEEDLDEKIVLEEDVQFDNTKYSNYKFEDIENEEDKISTNENIYAIRKGNEEYIVSYDSDNIVQGTYLIDNENNKLIKTEDRNELKIGFEEYDEQSYQNTYNNPKIKYYETGNYKGLPAIVPFDTNEGWYAAIEKSMSLGDVTRGYDESGKVNSFWVCNVGNNGIQEFSANLGDDICQKINPGTGQPINQFPGLKPSKASEIISNAQRAIEQASRRYNPGQGDIRILNQDFEVGSPYTGTPETKCTDFLSPKDCNLLYNVCDPVLCPSSRCDFGGNYPVKDPVQTGIIGSIALCMPNYPQVKIPVCLTGLNAGIDNLVSVFKSYQSCLEESLETGRTVGICDEIRSVYLCDFFWKEAIPLAKYGLSAALGQNKGGGGTGGGGEYFSGGNLWQNTKETVDFLTKEYSRESHRAFQQRSTESIGTTVCNAFASLTYPSGGNLIDTLTETRSPAQFTGKFEEMPMTTQTNPPMSQYKVTFHIYAGEDQPASYNVYLRGEQSSYYQSTGGLSGYQRGVDSGYIEAGGQKSKSRDFTAPSGYNQLCINVNGQEECGFKQVSTSFAVNRLSDNYVKEQVTSQDITTEQDCVSGKSTASNLLNMNLQQGVENTLDPKIYEKGIVRVCSTENPGLGTDANANAQGSRWKQVGYCGNTNVKCWLDTQSVEKSIKSLDIQNQTLSELEKQQKEMFMQGGDYLVKQEYEQELENITDIPKTLEKGPTRISEINDIIGKVFYNSQKAKLYFLRAETYKELSELLYAKLPKKKYEPGEVGEEEKEPETCDEKRETVEKIMNQEKGKGIYKDEIADYFDRIETPNNVSCWDSVDYIYSKAEVKRNCVYTAGDDVTFDLDWSEETISPQTKTNKKKYSCSSPSQCENSGKELSEKKKLNLLGKGDIISFVVDSGGPSPHNAIFVEWENEENNKAIIYDWWNQGLSYRKESIDLSDNKHPVYQIWNPCFGTGEVSGEDLNIKADSPVFKVRVRGIPVDYIFKDNDWYWRRDIYSSQFSSKLDENFESNEPLFFKEEWINLEEEYNGSFYYDSMYFGLGEVPSRINSILRDSSYKEGYNLLLENTIKEKTFSNSILRGEEDKIISISDKKTLGKSQRVITYQKKKKELIQIRYSENKWYWKPSREIFDVSGFDTKDWLPLNTSITGKNDEGYYMINYKGMKNDRLIYEGDITYGEDVKELVSSLKHKPDNFEDNIVILLNSLGSSEEEFNVYQPISMELEEPVSKNPNNFEKAENKVDELIEKFRNSNDFFDNIEIADWIYYFKEKGVLDRKEYRFMIGDFSTEEINKGNVKDLEYIKNYLSFKRKYSDFAITPEGGEEKGGKESCEKGLNIGSCYKKFIEQHATGNQVYEEKDNKYFVDMLYIHEVLNEEEYRKIAHKGRKVDSFQDFIKKVFDFRFVARGANNLFGTSWGTGLDFAEKKIYSTAKGGLERIQDLIDNNSPETKCKDIDECVDLINGLKDKDILETGEIEEDVSLGNIKGILENKKTKEEATTRKIYGKDVLEEEYSAYRNFLIDNDLEEGDIPSQNIGISGLHIVRLDVSDKGIEDVSKLSKLKELEYLWLDDNYISDVSSLTNLEKLKSLYLRNNCIDDSETLSELDEKVGNFLYENNPSQQKCQTPF